MSAPAGPGLFDALDASDEREDEAWDEEERGGEDEGAAHAHGEPGRVSCNAPGCGASWPRDPVLEVACPHPGCGAGVGQPCHARRPSGHTHAAAFGGLKPWGHDARDLAADAAGHYGPCPGGRCGTKPPAAPAALRSAAQLSLLVGPG